MYTGTFEPASNRANWPDFTINVVNDLTDEIIDVTTDKIEVSIEHIRDDGCCYRRLFFSTDNGRVLFSDDGTYFYFLVTVDEMKTLCPGRYKVFIELTRDGFTTQLMAAELPVVQGGPR